MEALILLVGLFVVIVVFSLVIRLTRAVVRTVILVVLVLLLLYLAFNVTPGELLQQISKLFRSLANFFSS
jgi:hypothetical protein